MEQRRIALLHWYWGFLMPFSSYEDLSSGKLLFTFHQQGFVKAGWCRCLQPLYAATAVLLV